MNKLSQFPRFCRCLVICAVFVISLHLTGALLPDRGHRHVSHRTLELEDSRNRQHVWDWLDRIHNERRNRSIGGGSGSDRAHKSLVPSFVTPQTPSDDVDDRAELMAPRPAMMPRDLQRKKTPRDAPNGAIDSSSIEVDYADDVTSGGANEDFVDRAKSAGDSRKQWPSGTGSTTLAPLVKLTGLSRPRSASPASISAMLKFSSNRTNASSNMDSPGVSQQRFASAHTKPKNPKKRLTSSVLNLPPVKQDWSFECPAGKSGYFADPDNDCRVYYVCSSDRGERQRFVCPLGTRFNQEQTNCDWWDKVSCESVQR